MKLKTNELTGATLDWAVAKCEGYEEGVYMRGPCIHIDITGKATGLTVPINREYVWFDPGANWSQGGPIIERESIDVARFNTYPDWEAAMNETDSNPFVSAIGSTPLIAAMRCFVASKLGDEIDVPEELV